MSQQELLKKITRALEENRIDYMVTGSVASSLQGEPRSTQDIDVVVVMKKADAGPLTGIFHPPRFYLDEKSIIAAIDNKDMFNLVDVKEGGKVDFWLLKDEPFDQSRFTRRQKENVMGFHMFVSSPEDTILMKLKWAKISGGSEKQSTDALRVYEVQAKSLDMGYLDIWAKKLGVESLWKDLKTKAQI